MFVVLKNIILIPKFKLHNIENLLIMIVKAIFTQRPNRPGPRAPDTLGASTKPTKSTPNELPIKNFNN